jgi:hypothetical protein
VGLCDVPLGDKSEGLGDTIGKVAKKLGIKKKPGCGCGKRQAKLNKLVGYKSS